MCKHCAWIDATHGTPCPEHEMPIVFEIYHPGEPAAGIIGFSDEITITVKSGDAGGERGEFREYMRQAILAWYDGAGVK